ncbi:helix-turn-helix transcriptional regulator [Qaidamihabitans albus]|uniref:helix-turn-helix transcriptional regulator n=1 Tax=Qaidamihabitans albus TaxID=2795733 RepID=UPI0018F114B9|nr:LuxR family transcriptional regulator [Qaidamihabitans albus]
MAAGTDITPARLYPVRGRERELAALTELLDGAARGRGGGLVVLGQPGVGKTTLLGAAGRAAARFRVLRACGTESETGLPLAGLHQLLRPLSGFLSRLSAEHREPLHRALGLGGRTPCEPFALHTAVHRLLTVAAAAKPTVCCVDSAHHLDAESLAALVFTAHRADPARIALLFAADRGGLLEHGDLLAELPSLRLGRLDDDAAARLLADRLGNDVPGDVSDSVLELARGNPLALTELATTITVDQLAGRAEPPAALPAESRLRRTVRARLTALPADARLVVLLAAVDERLSPDTVTRVAERSGLALSALGEAERAGLLVVTADVVRLPEDLLPCTVRAGAAPDELREAHRLLAAAADPVAEEYRWTWHRAAIATAPCPRLAGALDRLAATARRAHSYPEAAAASERAAALSPAGDDRALRLVSAAADHWIAGEPRRARSNLRTAAPLARGGLAGLAGILNGEIELRRGRPSVAAVDLLDTARRFAHTHRGVAITTLMLAGEATLVAGDDSRYCVMAGDAARLRSVDEQPTTRLVLDHFAAMGATFSGRHWEAAAPLRRVVALADSAGDPTAKILASQAAYTLGDAQAARELALQAVVRARAQGNPARVPWALIYASVAALLTDQHEAALSSSLEGLRLAESLGQSNCVVDHLTILGMHAALQGDGETAMLRLDAAASGLAERGLGRPGAFATWAAACADLADDRPAEAFGRFRRIAGSRASRYSTVRVLAVPHFVEAAVRCGEREQAVRALDTFERWANATGGEARRALAHRCQGLLAEEKGAAGEHFAEAIRLHRSAGAAYDLASTELLYANRLRRERKHREAQDLLREAVQIFEDMDARHWVRRAQQELRACGHPVRGMSRGATGELAPRQLQIAALVADGATNREVAAQLFISPRTVDHHLRNIFAKLDIRSRVELAKLFR